MHRGWRGFGFGFGPRGFAWSGGGPRRRQWFEAGDMRYVILKLLRDKPRHGYEVMKELEDRMHGCYSPSPGTVYPTLQWLEDEGLVSGRDAEGKKIYEITDAGRQFLHEHRDVVDDIFDRVREAVEHVAGGTSCGRLATPPGTILASATRRPSHLTQAATPSTGKSNEPRRRSLAYTASHPAAAGRRTSTRISSGCLVR